jgi:plasmid maintenance system antidote protein VapI
MKDTTMTKTKFRAFLDERGIRYSWLADQLGVSRPHLSYILDGQRPVTDAMAARLADIYGVPASTFQEETDTNA